MRSFVALLVCSLSLSGCCWWHPAPACPHCGNPGVVSGPPMGAPCVGTPAPVYNGGPSMPIPAGPPALPPQ
jgi:hypothetical protein